MLLLGECTYPRAGFIGGNVQGGSGLWIFAMYCIKMRKINAIVWMEQREARVLQRSNKLNFVLFCCIVEQEIVNDRLEHARKSSSREIRVVLLIKVGTISVRSKLCLFQRTNRYL